MVHKQYQIIKLRFGDGGEFKLWEYEAVSTTVNYNVSKPADRGVTSRYYCIDKLAKELSTFPGITHAEFIPSTRDPRVSLGNGTLTQNAVIGDEELGQLAVLVLKHVEAKERMIKAALGE